MTSTNLVACADVGSTYTKVAVVDVGSGALVATAAHPTTVRTDVLEGLILHGSRATNVGHQLNREILRLRPDVNAVIHLHHDETIAFFAAGYDKLNITGLTFPYLKDADGRVAESFGATRTPQAFVLDPARRVRYRGRIDDQYAPGGKNRGKPTRVWPRPKPTFTMPLTSRAVSRQSHGSCARP